MKKRNPFIASILSLITPGLGNLYNSQINNFFLFFVTINVFTWLGTINVFTYLVFAFLGLILWLFSIIQSFLEAKKIKKISLNKTKKFYLYLIPIIVFGISNHFATSDPKIATYNLPANSMLPTLQVGDYLVVKRNYYLENKINRGDLVIFKTKNEVDFIKRVIGFPGDTVQMKRGKLILNGKIIEQELDGKLKDINNENEVSYDRYIEKLTEEKSYSVLNINDSEMLDNTAEFLVPEGHYFMLGDNRDNSLDSRVLDKVGFVPFENILHKVHFIYWSKFNKSRIAIFPK